MRSCVLTIASLLLAVQAAPLYASKYRICQLNIMLILLPRAGDISLAERNSISAGISLYEAPDCDGLYAQGQIPYTINKGDTSPCQPLNGQAHSVVLTGGWLGFRFFADLECQHPIAQSSIALYGTRGGESCFNIGAAQSYYFTDP